MQKVLLFLFLSVVNLSFVQTAGIIVAVYNKYHAQVTITLIRQLYLDQALVIDKEEKIDFIYSHIQKTITVPARKVIKNLYWPINDRYYTSIEVKPEGKDASIFQVQDVKSKNSIVNIDSSGFVTIREFKSYERCFKLASCCLERVY
jgi:hypothetical protein